MSEPHYRIFLEGGIMVGNQQPNELIGCISKKDIDTNLQINILLKTKSQVGVTKLKLNEITLQRSSK